MFTAKTITALTLAACVSVPLAAETVLTDHNLDQLELMIPKLQQLQQRPQNNQFNLQQHCDWSKHYQQLSAQEKDKNMRRRQKHAYLSTWTGGLWIVGGTHSLGRFLLHNEKKESSFHDFLHQDEV